MIYEDKVKRTVVSSKIFGARIDNGSPKGGTPPLGIGDSYLINLKRNIFAVADSPDWNPRASREFLESFNQRMEQLFRGEPKIWNDQYDIEIFKDTLEENANELIREVDYLSSTTFTCLFVIPDMDELKGLLFHCGDSCIFEINLDQKKISQMSWTNMNMVGRSKRLSQVKLAKIEKDTRFVLCTDGAYVLSRNENHGGLPGILLDSFSQTDVDKVPDLLLDHYGRELEFPDDVTIVTLDPHKLPSGEDVIIAGGEKTLVDGYELRPRLVI